MKGVRVDKVDNYQRSPSSALNRIVNSILDKIVEDLKDYRKKDDKTGK